MNTEEIIVAVIVGLSAIYGLVVLYKTMKGMGRRGDCDKDDCGGCGGGSSCGCGK